MTSITSVASITSVTSVASVTSVTGVAAGAGITSVRGSPPGEHAQPSWWSPIVAPARAVLRAALRIPLLGKLAGANVLVATVAAVALVIVHRGGADADALLGFAVLGLAVGVAASIGLMQLALQPVARLRETLRHYARGDAGVRIRPSLVADRDLAGVGDAINDLLDDLMAERARIRLLARETIRGADAERARIARGLHDSTAQTLAALSMEARTALQLQGGRELTLQLELIRDLAVDAVREVRDLSRAIHPRVVDDLGLAAALGGLAGRVRETTGLETSLQLGEDSHHIPRDVASSLFRIAEAVLASAAQAGGARTATIRLDVSPGRVVLGIRDDGRGARHPVTELQALGERLALFAGTLTIHDREGRDRHVLAVVPIGPGADREPT